MSQQCGYEHTQKGIIQPLMALIGVVILAGTWFVRAYPTWPVCLVAAFVCFLVSFVFATLTVRDEGDRLAVRFGPIPLLRKTIPYAKMTAAEKDRSTLLAGWGIHWTRKGWLWNIGGFDCVRIRMGDKSTLIGTDAPDGLVAFLRTRIGPAAP